MNTIWTQSSVNAQGKFPFSCCLLRILREKVEILMRFLVCGMENNLGKNLEGSAKKLWKKHEFVFEKSKRILTEVRRKNIEIVLRNIFKHVMITKFE